MHRLSLGLYLVLVANQFARSDDDWQATGRVIDQRGSPVAGAAVGYFWGANGAGKRPNGTSLDVAKPEELREFWGHVGDMQPRGTSVVSDRDGRFTLTVPRRYHHLMALDPERRQGALVRVPRDEENRPLVLRLEPLIRLHGRFAVDGKQLAGAWTHVYIHLPEDEARPTDSFRVAHCGSFDARFELWLPAGKYLLQGYGQSLLAHDQIDLDAGRHRELNLRLANSEVDLGTLQLSQRELEPREKQMVAAKAAGTWGDYKKHYGQRPPEWHIADARKVPKTVRLSDFRGKWVLLYLWGPPCPGCLLDGIPKLMKFYAEHAAQREKFEILAFCTDCDNNLQSIADLDKFLEPTVKHVWKGKTLPFPVLLDPSFETMKRYGVLGYGTLLLIDPNGNLVRGDEQTLAAQLLEKEVK